MVISPRVALFYAAYMARTLSFYVILPISTHLISQEDVGKFLYYLSIANTLSLFLSFGLNSYIVRKSYNRWSLDYTCILCCFIVFLSGILFIATAALFFNYIYVIVTLVALFITLSMFMEVRFLCLGKYEVVTLLYLGHALIFICLGSTMLYLLEDYRVVLWALFLAEGMICLVGFHSLGIVRILRGARYYAYATGGPRVVRKAIVYSAPIMLGGVVNGLLTTSDRFLVKHFCGFEQVAVFSIMYTIAFASNRFVSTPINKVLAPLYMRSSSSTEFKARYATALPAGYLILISYSIAACFGGNLVLGFLGKDYMVAPINFILVSMSSAFLYVFTLESLRLKIENRTLAFAGYLVAAFLINFMASFLLIPSLGYLGASISTLLSYLALLAATVVRIREPLIDRRLITASIALAAALVGLEIL